LQGLESSIKPLLLASFVADWELLIIAHPASKGRGEGALPL
jgi:hypothetical protein